MITMIITLGSRDLQLRADFAKEPLAEWAKHYSVAGNPNLVVSHPREFGEALKSDPEKLNYIMPFLEYPIIRPSVEYVFERVGKPDRIIWVVTNNPFEVKEQFRKNDTLFYPAVLEKLIAEDFRRQNGGAIRHTVFEVRKDVISLNLMYDLFTAEFGKPGGKFSFKPEEKLYLHAQGGIDAINTALLLKSIESKPDVVCMTKPEGSPFAFPMAFPQVFQNNLVRERVKQALDEYQYPSVSDATTDPVIGCLAEYAGARIALDHRTAMLEARKLIEISPGDQELAIRLASDVASLTQKDLERELYWSAMAKFRQKNYADYLWRLFTIRDNLFMPVVEKHFGEEIVYDRNSNHRQWNELLARFPEVVAHLKTIKFSPGNPLNYSEPSPTVYRYIVEYLYPREKSELPGKLWDISDGLNNLSGLRNDIAHRYKGVSYDMISGRLGRGRTVEEFNQQLGEYVGQEAGGMGVYDRINDRIRQQMK
ncbi:MAG: hypothetical protein R3C61_08585 [Bacteroidia bacterium]